MKWSLEKPIHPGYYLVANPLTKEFVFWEIRRFEGALKVKICQTTKIWIPFDKFNMDEYALFFGPIFLDDAYELIEKKKAGRKD